MTLSDSGAGREWLVEAFGCEAARLARVTDLQQLFQAVVHEVGLHPVGEAHWHTFPAPGGVTGVWLLAESHLTVHTFPEFGSACFNLFCCTPREAWNWEERLETWLGAERVSVRAVDRVYHATPVAP